MEKNLFVQSIFLFCSPSLTPNPLLITSSAKPLNQEPSHRLLLVLIVTEAHLFQNFMQHYIISINYKKNYSFLIAKLLREKTL